MRSKGYYLPKCTGPVEQRQICGHPTTAHRRNTLLVSTVLPTALRVGGNPVATRNNQFCSSSCPLCSAGCKGPCPRPQRTCVPSRHAHTHTWTGGLCLDSRGQGGPKPQAIAWRTALPFASRVSGVVPSQARGDGPCCPLWCGITIFSLPVPTPGFCYKPNSFQSATYAQVYPSSASGLRYFICLVKPRRKVLTSEMWPHSTLVTDSSFQDSLLGRGEWEGSSSAVAAAAKGKQSHRQPPSTSRASAGGADRSSMGTNYTSGLRL